MVVRMWLARLEADGVSATTRAKSYRLLARILRMAVEARYIARSPCTIKGAGVERAPEMRFATVAEVQALADKVGEQYRAMILVAALAGLRWGELAGLRRKRVDLRNARLVVAEQLTEINGKHDFSLTKTRAGERPSRCRAGLSRR
jgi:integrase